MSTWKELKDNPRQKQIFNDRIVIVRAVREFFWGQDFVEAETPIAVRYMSQEPFLNPMPVEYVHPHGEKYRFYLHTSPEYALKKILCAGWTKVFEICKCFRNVEDFGGTHNPEFTMIEWYRSPGKLQEIMDDTENLFKFVGKKLGKDYVEYEGKKIPIDSSWERITMKDLWKKFIGINLDEYLGNAKMAELCREWGYTADEKEPYEDLFYKIFLNEIESKLVHEKPVMIYDYPTQMASLSTLCADPRYAERFECYVGGLELCNAFGELTDPDDQYRRLEADRQFREDMGKEHCPVDPAFIAALRSGMAPAGGIALGIDRMVLLFTGARDLNEVIFQSAQDQVTP